MKLCLYLLLNCYMVHNFIFSYAMKNIKKIDKASTENILFSQI